MNEPEPIPKPEPFTPAEFRERVEKSVMGPTPAEGRIADLMPDPRETAKSIHRQAAAMCGYCEGTGGADSGGVTPWGSEIIVKCPRCGGTGKPQP